MNTEEKQITQTSDDRLTVNSSSSTSLTTSRTASQLLVFGEQLSATLQVLPDYLNNLFQVYKNPLIVIGWAIASIVSLKIVFAVLGAVNDIPLLQPILELIGVICGGWFVVRYLISAENRAELGMLLNSLKEYIFGDNRSDNISN
ncbi:MAG: CAAD domain-containing protein [Xenococcaceae cyanobacterium]